MKRLRRLAAPLIALGAALALTAAATALLSDEGASAVAWLVSGPLRSGLALGNLLATASRLTLAGLAAALAFRAGAFNLGGEGQALAGGLAAAALALALPDLPRFVALPLAVLAGLAAGAAVGALSGFLRARWGVDELISSFLVSAALVPVGPVLLGGPMKDPDSYLIAAPPLSGAYRLASWWSPSRLGAPLVWSLLLAAAVVVFLRYTRRGYEWRLRGVHESFARYGGIRTGAIAVAALASSGALFGLAGAAALMDGGQAIQGFTGGLGWNGLAVALIAGTRPELVPLAALAYAWLTDGTQAAMMHTGFSFSLSGLVQAAVFLLVTARFAVRRRRPS